MVKALSTLAYLIFVLDRCSFEVGKFNVYAIVFELALFGDQVKVVYTTCNFVCNANLFLLFFIYVYC